jgi:hypothetical protein
MMRFVPTQRRVGTVPGTGVIEAVRHSRESHHGRSCRRVGTADDSSIGRRQGSGRVTFQPQRFT